MIRANTGSGQHKAGGSGSKGGSEAPAGSSSKARTSGMQAHQGAKAGSGGAAAAQRLSCFVNKEHMQGKPTVAAKSFAPGDAEVCASWQVHCSSGHKACSPAEVAARSWKWVYTAASVARCAEVQAKAVSGARSGGGGGFRFVTCCSSSNCNRPVAALDPHTQIATAA